MGLGERRGGRRAGGHRRRAHHRHNHHRNRHRRRHHGGRGFHGARPVLRLGWRRRGAGGGGVGGGSVVPISGGHYALLIMLIMAAAFGFIVGMTLANIGGWVSTTLGRIGMFMLFASFIFIIILVVMRCNMMKLPPTPAAGGVEAGNATMTVSTVTIAGSTTASQIDETTSYTSQVSAFQPGGVAMGMQPGYAGGPVQPPPPGPFQPPPPTQSFTVAPYPPAQNGGAPHPPVNNPVLAPIVPPPQQPVVPPPGTYNYPVQSLPGGNVGVAIPNNPNGNNDAPPPSYNDVISGNVR